VPIGITANTDIETTVRPNRTYSGCVTKYTLQCEYHYSFCQNIFKELWCKYIKI